MTAVQQREPRRTRRIAEDAEDCAEQSKDVVHATGGCTGKLVARIGGHYGNSMHGTGGKPAGNTGSLREGADVGAPRSAPRAQQGRFFYVCGGAVIACRSQPEARSVVSSSFRSFRVCCCPRHDRVWRATPDPALQTSPVVLRVLRDPPRPRR